MANHLFKDFLPEKDAVVDLASQMLANYLESAGEDADTKTTLAKKEAELDALAQRKQRNMNFLLDGTLDAVMFKQNEAQISADIEAAQEEITALRKELTENNTQEVLEERIRRLKTLLADYVSVDSEDNIIPELVVTAFVKQIIVFEDHFEWYLRTDTSNEPIACKVKGRVNTDKVFTLSDSIYPYCIPQDRPLLRANIIPKSSRNCPGGFFTFWDTAFLHLFCKADSLRLPYSSLQAYLHTPAARAAPPRSYLEYRD